jgi:arylsulfatase B/arylsulfatase I/J
MRAVGFVHAPPSSGLLPVARVGTDYHGLVHVSDWLPTLIHIAGGDPSTLAPGIDGMDMWPAISAGTVSPRTELLHGIDVVGGVGSSGFGNAGIRVGNLKLLVGQPGVMGGHYAPPGCSATACPQPKPPAAPAGVAGAVAATNCTADTATTGTWLFDIDADPLELCNLAVARPADVQRLLGRLLHYNQSAVPAQVPPNDPASIANRTGENTGCWTPWMPDSAAN